MTALALRLSGQLNAVSQRHGVVSRRVWRGMWPGVPGTGVPIAAITNGVHLASWVAPEMEGLFRKYLGPDWIERHDEPTLWGRVETVPAHEVGVHRALEARPLQSSVTGTFLDTVDGGHVLCGDVVRLAYSQTIARRERRHDDAIDAAWPRLRRLRG